MSEQLFRFAFKYPRFVFDQGELAWGVSGPLLTALIVVGGIAVAALLTYHGVGTLTRTRDRVVLVGLRLGVLALLLFSLFRPMLILRAAVPQQNFLGVLLDDSRSMAITDRDGDARSAFVQQAFGRGPDSPLLKALSDKFVLRFFRFSSSVDRVTAPDGLAYDGTATRLGPALDRARDELSGLPLAGLVMVTDGADTSDTTIDEQLAGLKARSIPVFTLGVGRERFEKDIQVTRVETPRTALKGTSLVVDVVLSQTGFSGETVAVTVEDDGRIVNSENVTLPGNGEAATAKVRFTASEAGPRLFSFKVAVQEGEQVTQNNSRDALIEVADRQEKVLYLEGEPRFEAKFIRRATEDDTNLSVVILQRTAENKYFRLGVDRPDDLVGGFPETREELFAYRAIILGSIEAAAFSPDQQRMLADFVSRRGGGLLMLGGRRAFAEGGWGGTPLAEALPVVIDAPGGAARHRLLQRGDCPADARGGAVSGHPGGRRRQEHHGVERPAAGHDGEPDQRRQAGRDGAAERHRQSQRPAGHPRLPALRARQGARDADSGFVALVHESDGPGHRHDPLDVLAPPRALARGRRAGAGQRHDDAGSGRAGGADQDRGRSARRRVR